MKKKSDFDYTASVKEVERLIALVENPDTGVEKSALLAEKARKLLDECSLYLKSERDN